MTGRTAVAVLGVSLLACAWIDRVHAGCLKPAGCIVIDDRLEAEFGASVNLNDLTSAALVTAPALAPLNQVLVTHQARLTPSFSARSARVLHLERFYTVRFPQGVHKSQKDLAAIRKELLNLGPSIVRRVALVPAAAAPTPPDPYVGATSHTVVDVKSPCGTQWYLHATNVDAAWKCGATGAGVVVADVDWGFMTDHEDLKTAFDLQHAFDICATTLNLADNDPRHGTGVAGLIAARQNEVGTQGIAYGTTIWPVQAACASSRKNPCDQSWGAAENPWATAISTVAVEDCHECRKVLLLEVQTCCEGSYEGGLTVPAAIRAAIAANVVVVVAAGNGNRDAACDDFGDPIEETGAIVAGATSYGDTNPRHRLSNYGDRILVSAPGADSKDLTTTLKDSACDESQGPLAAYTPNFGGTSGAAAKVAAVVALMLQKNPELTPQQVRDILNSTGGAVDISANPSKKAGKFLDAGAAVAAATPGGCP